MNSALLTSWDMNTVWTVKVYQINTSEISKRGTHENSSSRPTYNIIKNIDEPIRERARNCDKENADTTCSLHESSLNSLLLSEKCKKETEDENKPLQTSKVNIIK